jgi:hypothetical protein
MKRLVPVLVVALALVGVLVPRATSSSAAPGDAPPPPPPQQRPAEEAPNFVSACRFSHRLPDDPIVKPGQPGASHSHDFFANTTTDAHSTYDSLRAGSSTCRDSLDTAGYWVPSLLQNGRQVTPLGVRAYYTLAGKPAASIKPFPAGLEVVAGKATATGPQSLRVASWSCGPASGVRAGATPPSCPTGHLLRMHIRFPDCWNGFSLDSPDHAGHMSYSSFGRCPAGYPVPVPKLTLNVVYPILGGPGITLSSGSAYTGHGDFFNAWDQQRLEELVRTCLNAGVHCGVVS